MSDPLERVSVSAGGRSYTGFESVSISISAEEAVRTATLEGSDFGGTFPLLPGTEVTVKANGTLILTGYVRDCAPSHDGTKWSASISLVSKSVDAVECSIVHPKGWAEKKSLTELAKEFDTQGVGIEASESFPVEPNHFVNPGASLFDEIEPLARAQSAFIYDTPEGKLRIAKKPRGRHAGGLKLGVNIIAASAKLTENGRHSPVIVRGQSTSGSGKAALQLEARVADSGVKRQRPKIIIDEAETTSGRLKSRAERQVKRAAGYSREANVEVSGWRDQSGRIWEPHFTVRLDDKRIYIGQDMVIKSVTLTQDASGTRASLSLADPRAMNGEAGGASSSAGFWATPDAQAQVLGA
jgi:prophage tail gpP-like protein